MKKARLRIHSIRDLSLRPLQIQNLGSKLMFRNVGCKEKKGPNSLIYEPNIRRLSPKYREAPPATTTKSESLAPKEAHPLYPKQQQQLCVYSKRLWMCFGLPSHSTIA